MSRLYSRLRTLTKNAGAWAADYVYITSTQLKGLVARRKSAESSSNADKSYFPVVVLPGIYETWYVMKPVVDVLEAHGYAVHTIESLKYNHFSIEESAQKVRQYIEHQQISEYVIVAHSKGGLIGKYVMMGDEEHRCRGMVSVTTPFGGSHYAYLSPFKTLRLFTPRSAVLAELALNRQVNARIVSIFGEFDPVITTSSFLEGARNIQLPIHGHFRILAEKTVHESILTSLSFLLKKR